MENPWNVKNLDEFLYFWCPECDTRDKSKVMFVKHALDNHPNSREYVVHLAIKKEHYEIDEYEALEQFEPKTELMDMEDIKCEDNLEYVSCENRDFLKDLTKKTKDSDKPKKTYKLKSRKCEYCGEEFPNKILFKNHKRDVHKDIKEHKCDNCNKAFKEKRTLNKHIQIVHEK